MTAVRSLDSVRFDALRNALYHTARRRSLEALDRWGNFFVVLFGAATVTQFGQWLGFGDISKVLATATAVVGAAKLAFNFASRARDHERLQRRYYDLLADIETHASDTTEEMVRGWQATIVKITGDEPPLWALIDAISYNEAGNALGAGPQQLLVIPWWARIVGRVTSLSGYRFLTFEERDHARRSLKSA